MLRILNSWRQYIAVILVFSILLSQTIRVDFFTNVEASQAAYRDIVSILVDEATYKATRPKIMRYAEDIQTYLGSTQVSLYVVGNDTPVETIAAQNEKLYYEGTDSEKVDRLVGVILVGNVPIPMVSTESDIFPSIYPYVDFVDKKFVYDNKTKYYKVAENVNQKVIEPEVWHGVINPAVGRDWDGIQDIGKIEDFFDKTHDFYSQQGIFAPSTIPPRVFYYDGFSESAATDQRSLFQYGLNMKNSENIAYKRFTKYLLTDINTALKQYDAQYKTDDTALLKSFGVDATSDTLDADTLKSLPDIQTEAAIDGLIKDFYAIINKKTLGDELLAVRNAGRYSSSDTVRADIASTMVTTMDTVARSTLLDANNSIMESIDVMLRDKGYAKKIPIFDTFSRKEPIVVQGSYSATYSSGSYGYNEFVYQNYYLGQKSSSVLSPEQCSIARGSNNSAANFGRSILVEANTMYDTALTEGHATKLEADTSILIDIQRNASFACFDTATSKPKTLSYWGDNSMLSLATSGNSVDIFSIPPSGTVLSGMTESIFSLNGMKETTRFAPATIADCTSPQYQYALENPTKINYIEYVNMGGDSDTQMNCTKSSLSEWNIRSGGWFTCSESISPKAPDPLRYSCLSKPKQLTRANNFSEDIYRYTSTPCIGGTLTLNGSVVLDPRKSCIDTIGFGEDSYTVDNTIYENVSYHTIPSILRHISPTDAEIAAAKDSGVTPSLPVDMVRYVEFLTPKGNLARIDYPNFFAAEGDDIASFRAWLTNKSRSDWNNIIAQENATTVSARDAQANVYLGTGVLPESPIDWNVFVSDEVILKIIQSRNWLTPDVTKKYTQSIENMLSYSQNSSTKDISSAPEIPKENNSYEIAYLGLSSFLPGELGSPDQSVEQTEYNSFRSKMRAINISEDTSMYGSPTIAPSDNCGPPDGVSLFQWPSAIVCWIKSLTPVRIIGMACGANTIGMKNSISAATRIPTSGNLDTIANLRSFYTGGKLVYNLERQSILPDESTDITFYYVKDNTVLGLPSNTQIKLDTLSFRDTVGNLLNQSIAQDTLEILPNPTTITQEGGRFVISPQGIKGEATLQATITLKSSDSQELQITSDPIALRISDEYIDIIPSVGGKVMSNIVVTSSSGMAFDFAIKNQSGIVSTPQFPIKLSIYDEVGETYISSGITITSSDYILPSSYTKEIGVYRLGFQDSLGRIGSHSIAVQAGPLNRVNISPISSSFLRGSDTPVILRLRDALGNPITPDLHGIDISVKSGYILTQDGQRKTSMHIDSMDSEVSLTIGTDTLDPVSIDVVVDDVIKASHTLSVFDTAYIVLSREGTSQVGSASQKVVLRVEGSDKKVIAGFNSIAHLSLPQGAGNFSPNVLTIRDGISEIFEYIPGQLAGEHKVTAAIPGLGVIPDIAYTVAAGEPLYVSHTEKDGNLIFSLRDRYDNLSPSDIRGTIQANTQAAESIQFINGIYTYPKISGITSVNVPGLSEKTINYVDASGIYTLTGSQYYTAYSRSSAEKFDFHDDYNARYTVLAGGAFLREAEDILYNTTVGSGQSLAVTTLLDTPYVRDSIVSFSPGGGYVIYNASDIIPEPTLTLQGGYPVITFRDSISQSILAEAFYHTTAPQLNLCSSDCVVSTTDLSEILLTTTNTTFTTQRLGSNIALMQGGLAVVTIYPDGKIQHLPGVVLSLNTQEDNRGIVIDIEYSGRSIGAIYYRTDSTRSIVTQDPIDTVAVKSYAQYILDTVSVSSFSSPAQGLRLVSPVATQTLDTTKNGPETTESLGLISEIPSVGWQGSNRMLLSYAGGDTVGEASRWFHTYTMINLGDPVTHNDKSTPGTEYDGLDRSLGTQLTSTHGSPVESYMQADMNKDGYDDIIVLHTNGYVELLLNLVDRIRSKGNIAYIPDIISRGFSVADFTGDGYGDILGVDEDGDFVLIDNTDRRFSRMSLSVQPGASLPTAINQFEVRDMDQDNLDDIVYVTEGGELAILYGTVTPGLYQKNILDSTLGITLSDTPGIIGGAIYTSHIPQVSLTSSTTSTELDATQLYREIYYPFSYIGSSTAPTSIDTSTALGRTDMENELSALSQLEKNYEVSSIDSSQLITSTQSSSKNYLRSEYAETQGLLISKTYKHIVNPILRAGDTVRATIEIKNTTTKTITDIEYLDSVPTIFDISDTKNYSMILGTNSISRDFIGLSYSDFGAYFSLFDIGPGETLMLSYDLKVLPASYGKLLVGDYEKGETGHDIYGDIAFQTDTSCGADMMLWRSDAARGYTRGTRTFASAELPGSLTTSLLDVDNNGVPDSIENMTLAEQKNLLNTVNTTSATASKNVVNINLDTNRQMLDINFDAGAVSVIQNQIQDIMDGLACGFGGGSCMSFPMNWAPLAPGSAPVAFGYPLSNLTPSTGKPVFSALTCQLVTFSCGMSPCTFGLPSVFPASKMGANGFGVIGGANNGMACGNPSKMSGAGGSLGTNSLMNSIRIYVTPTLTLGVGAAFCFGQPAVAGQLPPPAIWPLAPGGNCIVVAKPMSMCKDDGSVTDGDVRGISGLGSLHDTWNAGSCTIQADTGGAIEDENLRRDIVAYTQSPDTTKLPGIYNRLGARTSSTLTGGPLLRMGGATSGGALAGVDITLDSAKPLDIGNIVKLNNKRIAGFPDFIMDWVARQTDQITNAFLTPPNLIIIPPTSVGQNSQFDGSIKGFSDIFKNAYNESSLENIKKKSGEAYSNTVAAESASKALISKTQSKSNAQSELGQWMQSEQSKFDQIQDSAFKSQVGKIANEGKGGIAAMRSAYKLVGKLPLISISEKTIAIDVPWILPQELDRYSRSLDAYSKELDSATESFCVDDPSPECAIEKGRLQSSGLKNSINQNLKMIEEYKNFPVKLQKYVTWKQRYLSQVLCYITEVQQMTTGWVKDNSIRFQKWAELVVLIRAIADSWQPVLDIVAQKDAQCAVCHNERYNAKYFKYKIISALIPSIPVIQFPRWPDIVLDLSDVRLGIVLMMPNFQFNLKPIRLPDIPRLSLPRAPGISLTLPTIPLIPPIPSLPDLPDLPSIPTIKLPNLPPPPKLPKLFASLGVGLKILKLFQIMECYLNKTTLVPEWTVGDVIAQRTERQGTLPMDFLDVSFPQLSIPSIREIRVSSHVNFDIRSEFVAEFAQAAVKPINEFNADLGRGIPKKIGDDIHIDAPTNININLQSSTPTTSHDTISGYITEMEQDTNVFFTIDEFKVELQNQFSQIPEFAIILQSFDEKIARAHKDAQMEEKKLLAYNDEKFQKLRTYIELQYSETAQMQNIIDLLQSEDQKLLVTDHIARALLVSDTLIIESAQLANEWNNKALYISDTAVSDDGFGFTRNAISARIGRLAASSTTSSSSSSPVASGYSPNYNGIYIITEGGNQTRLFDYIEPLHGDDTATRVDIDRDGDMDYLYILDGTLFLKRATLRDTKKIIDTTISTKNIDSDIFPTAPDFFHEDSSLSNTFSFSYDTTSDTDSIWRVEFYDRYMEWDMVKQGTDDPQVTPRHVIEIASQNKIVKNKTIRTLDRVDDVSEFIMEGPRVEILTGAMDFTLSPGRVLYAGDTNTTILYSTGSDAPYIRKTLTAAEQITFDETTNISLKSGKVFVIYPSVLGSSYTYTDDILGMPIVPGMRIATGDGEVILRDRISDTDMVLMPRSTYRYEEMYSMNQEYSVRVPYPNGYYFPKITNLYGTKVTSAGEILFAPRASSDISMPLVNLDTTVRVPVYQKKEIFFKDIITEMSDYSVHIDADLSQDTDSNGLYDDDFYLYNSTGVTITDNSVIFGPFETIGTKNMVIKVEDEFHNISITEFQVEVYPPIPTIVQATSTGLLRGMIDESLSGEPIDIFRVRTGMDIIRLNQDMALNTADTGTFSGNINITTSGSVLSHSGSRVDLSERGVYGALPKDYTAQLILADASNPMHLIIKNSLGAALYKQFLVLPDGAQIIDLVQHPLDGTGNGLLITPMIGYKIIAASIMDPSIPGGSYIVNNTYNPIIAIARDGNIYPIASGVTATFTQKDGYPQISLKVGGVSFADLLYKFDFFYTLK